jgi:hypothetical protein
MHFLIAGRCLLRMDQVGAVGKETQGVVKQTRPKNVPMPQNSHLYSKQH